ncbi:hypothetical protein EJ110_NYTH06236 [Nymphaea thermarum]|nr:hypothetical protein EJ110_NYTH06236 [Nymphaea thermarum]
MAAFNKEKGLYMEYDRSTVLQETVDNWTQLASFLFFFFFSLKSELNWCSWRRMMDEDEASTGERLLGRKEDAASAEWGSTGSRNSGSSWVEDGWWGSGMREMRRQGVIALPLVLVTMFQFLLQVVSLMMVGHLGSLSLSSAAIASSLCNVTGHIILLGMASALETLCGQAYGAEQYQKLGLHTQKAIIALLVVCIPISILWFYMEKLLILIGQDSDISHEAGKYAVCLLPGLFGAALLQPMVKFLQSQSLVLPLLGASAFTLFFHVPVCWLLLFKSSLGYVGAAVAVSLSYWVNVAALALYIKFAPACRKTSTLFSREAITGIHNFLGLALLSAVMICLEYWSFELLVLVSGLLPDPELEASVLSIWYGFSVLPLMSCLISKLELLYSFNIYSLYLVYSIPYGLGAAARCTLHPLSFDINFLN